MKEHKKTIPHLLYNFCNCRKVLMRSFGSLFFLDSFQVHPKLKWSFAETFHYISQRLLCLMANCQHVSKHFSSGTFIFSAFLTRGARDFIFRYRSIRHSQATNITVEFRTLRATVKNARRLCSYIRSAALFCRYRVVFLRSFISVLFLYLCQIHPCLK